MPKSAMLFMVVESFPAGSTALVGERFRSKGRMIPDGVSYVASWMEANGDRCFQIMEAPTRTHLNPWLEAWQDLVQFEVTEILASHDYWAAKASSTS